MKLLFKHCSWFFILLLLHFAKSVPEIGERKKNTRHFRKPSVITEEADFVQPSTEKDDWKHNLNLTGLESQVVLDKYRKPISVIIEEPDFIKSAEKDDWKHKLNLTGLESEVVLDKYRKPISVIIEEPDFVKSAEKDDWKHNLNLTGLESQVVLDKYRKPISVIIEEPDFVKSAEKDDWKYKLNLTGLESQVVLDKYRKNTYDPVEVEKLLQLDVKNYVLAPNFWRSETPGPQLAQIEPQPICSQRPSSPEEEKMISAHEYFQSQIQIPVQKVNKLSRFIKYQHIPSAHDVWKEFMECDCNIVQEDGVPNEVCVDGKINFSRGVGGDKSFFVFVPISPERYKAVAHIYFEEDGDA